MPEAMPALTDAEHDVVDCYMTTLKILRRINPARTASSVDGCRNAADALVSESRKLRDALARMQERGEREVFTADLGKALRLLHVDDVVARLGTSPGEPS